MTTTTVKTTTTTPTTTAATTTTVPMSTTTTGVPTTTINPDDCDVMPVNWRGSKYSKSKNQFLSFFSQQVQVSILKKNGEDDLDQGLNIRKHPYIGYLIWSRKMCGPDFLNGIVDGRVNLEFFDYG